MDLAGEEDYAHTFLELLYTPVCCRRRNTATR